ncbi:MAG: hypothetical protein KDH99_12355 [Alcanivoracaceae bacterium]|nr:hypothetical protein [Alcanivoracaceae bacterium]
MLRTLLVCLLLVSLPLQAITPKETIRTPCPMAQAMGGMAMDAGHDEMSQQIPDCCEDDDTLTRTGHACKTGQSCQVTQTSIPLDLSITDTFAAAPAQRQAPPPDWSPLALNAIWRPPLHAPR